MVHLRLVVRILRWPRDRRKLPLIPITICIRLKTIHGVLLALPGTTGGNPEPEGSANPTVTPDLDFYYDDSSDTWKAIGQVKLDSSKFERIMTGVPTTVTMAQTDRSKQEVPISQSPLESIFSFWWKRTFTLTIEPADRAWDHEIARNNWGQMLIRLTNSG